MINKYLVWLLAILLVVCLSTESLASCGRHEADLAELIRHDNREDHPFRVASDDF